MDTNTTIKKFRFGTRFVRASLQRVYPNRHVFILSIPDTPLLKWFVSWIPGPIRSLLHNILPEWFLPVTLVLKEKHPEKPEGFQNEVKAYEQLKTLQGGSIPCFYGQVKIDDKPGFLMEYIDGLTLDKLSWDDMMRVWPLLHEIQERFKTNGVVHDDPRLDNFILTKRNGRELVVPIDFEHMILEPRDEQVEHDLETLKDLITTRDPNKSAEDE